MTTCHLEQTLRSLCNIQVDLVLNNNRTTMISILERKRKYIRLSIHRMFLKASGAIVDAIVDFIHNQKSRHSSLLLQNFINTQLPKFGYEKKLNHEKLSTLGQAYDLKTIYHQLNKTYFDNQLDLNITWYGMPHKRRGCTMTYGLYSEPLKLIKVHRLLDRYICPEFYVAFVIYHEMLHEVHKPYMGVSCTHIHTPEFKAQEKQFKYFKEAVAWEKKSRRLFFR